MGKADKSPHVQFSPHPLLRHLPPYKAPSTGLLSFVPTFLLPYAELARIDKPGFATLWIVHMFGILHAGIILQAPPSKVFYLIAYFFPACWFLMCLNFAWNDSCDPTYDRKVARTRHRPLVRGALSLSAAITFDCALALILAAFLIPLPRACRMYALPMAVGCFIYPLSKRWTNYPQLVLGVVLASGVFMGAAAVGATPLPYPSRLATVHELDTWTSPQPRRAFTIFNSFWTVVIWTILFEIIYSFQDVKWDEGAGIGTLTRFLKERRTAKTLLLMLAICQTVLHAQAGNVTQAQSIFWPFSVAATFTTLVIQIYYVCLDKEESCMFWFGAGNMMTGLAMLIGYAGEYYIQTLR